MKDVYIEYNPYRLETNITIDGKPIATEGNDLYDMTASGTRLQEWIDDLPNALMKSEASREFKITFHGTKADYDDMVETIDKAVEEGLITASLSFVPAKDTGDKTKKIQEVFEKIQNGPFDELRSDDVINAFKNALNNEFEVCVVAQMSTGKSTLINALLGNKLMPAKKKACTAVITRIKDSDGKEWSAIARDKEGNILETDNKLDLSIMRRLNDDERISEIDILGDIPFVNSKDISLVLVDTPGPNNHRDPEHGIIQQDFLSKSSEALVIYVVQPDSYETNGNYDLLKNVGDSMSVKGKMSRDRFIFVINKMDDRKSEDEDVKGTIKNNREFLEDEEFGIVNPNIYPVAALPALGARTIHSGIEDSEACADVRVFYEDKLCGDYKDYYYMETENPLPRSIKDSIENSLKEAEKTGDVYQQVLIHSGIISLEAAIRQYVEKYAKTAKIKNVADTLTHNLSDQNKFVEIEKQIACAINDSESNADKIAKEIDRVQSKIDSLEKAGTIEEYVSEAKNEIVSNTKKIINNIEVKVQAEVTGIFDKFGSLGKVEKAKANQYIESFEGEVKNLEPKFYQDLKDMLEGKIEEVIDLVINEYKRRLEDLDKEDAEKLGEFSFKIDPLNLVSGSLSNFSKASKDKYVHNESVFDGYKSVLNTEKKWYKPWTWFQKKYIDQPKYKDVTFIDIDGYIHEVETDIEAGIYDNGDSAEDYVKKQCDKFGDSFNAEVKKLNGVILEKTNQLKTYRCEKDQIDVKLDELKKRQQWLLNIKDEIDEITAI